LNEKIRSISISRKMCDADVWFNSSVGAAILAGGAVGFARKGSRASLIAGATIGSLFGVAAFLSSQEAKANAGRAVGAVSGGALALGMGIRAQKSGSRVAASLALLGASALLYNVFAYRNH
jgi:uncharacterized membrane protein (UPF0136 family)